MSAPLGVLITGAGGQLGQALCALEARARDAGLRWLPAPRAALDICDAAALARRLDAEPVAAIINAAAYTAVDRAEAEPELAGRVNALGPRVLAAACRERGIRLVQISTDYVFDGTKGAPYVEGDTPNPLGVYGRTKRAGELAALAAPDAIVLRTGWVFSEFGHNFFRTMLRLGAEREVLAVVDDQWGGPTPAPAIAAVLVRLLARLAAGAPLPGGIYHFGGAPAVTWCGFARAIFAAARQCGLLERMPEVRPITTAEYPAAAPRPADARLDCGRLESLLGPLENDWRAGLAAALAALGAERAG
ncbi:MAG: dTDP-4-dehydrorhamnose reductase [Pseudomonadota bacterium]